MTRTIPVPPPHDHNTGTANGTRLCTICESYVGQLTRMATLNPYYDESKTMMIELKQNHDSHYTLTFEHEGVSNGCVVLKCVSTYNGDASESSIRLPPELLLELCEAVMPWLRKRTNR